MVIIISIEQESTCSILFFIYNANSCVLGGYYVFKNSKAHKDFNEHWFRFMYSNGNLYFA
jgi:hypothetical protein